ncbi:hypothetical protein P0F65_21585 [Sphingomonas sp. I4]
MLVGAKGAPGLQRDNGQARLGETRQQGAPPAPVPMTTASTTSCSA